MPAPEFRSNSTYAGATGSHTMTLPAGYAVDDLLVLCVEGANNTGSGMSGIPTQGQTNLTNNGWTRAANSNTTLLAPTVAASQNVFLDIWYNRATTTSQTAVAIGDSGDHTQTVCIALKNVIKTGNPFVGAINVTVTTATAQTNSKNLITSTANTLIVHVVCSPRDAAAAHINASPLLFTGDAGDVELTERCDFGVTSGTGGTIGILTHRKSNLGATANLRCNTVTSNVSIIWTGAIKGTYAYSQGGVSVF
jgi:hypothetical protein